MRPCNQCRKPVENDVFICKACEAFNEERGIEPPTEMGAYQGDPNPENFAQMKPANRFVVLPNAFSIILFLIGALTGLLYFETFGAFLIGGLVSLIGGTLGFRLLVMG